MKFTSEDLMKYMGLQVGDRIKVKFDVCSPYYQDTINSICEIIKNITGHIMIRNENNQTMFIHNLVDIDFEILPIPKRVGETLCERYCNDCPLVAIQCFSDETEGKQLYEVLQQTLPNYLDQEIYDLLKARLDKEVE